MSKRTIYFIVEGNTEEQFIYTVLRDHFSHFNVTVTPKLLGKRKDIRGPFDLGGTAIYTLTINELKRYIASKDAVVVTTMIDYYALHSSYGKTEIVGQTNQEKAKKIEAEMAEDLGKHRKFVPYIQLHDFEALLFSSPKTMASVLGSNLENKISKVKNNHPPNPEAINDRKDHCPKHQIKRIIVPEEYGEISHGIRIAKRIGLTKMRDACPHFNEWITKLEKLASS